MANLYTKLVMSSCTLFGVVCQIPLCGDNGENSTKIAGLPSVGGLNVTQVTDTDCLRNWKMFESLSSFLKTS